MAALALFHPIYSETHELNLQKKFLTGIAFFADMMWLTGSILEYEWHGLYIALTCPVLCMLLY